MTILVWPFNVPKRIFWSSAWLGWCLTTHAAPSQAQHLGLWVWKDAQGQMVYSDREPPPGIKPKQIVQQPQVDGPIASPGAHRARESSAAHTLSAREAIRRDNCLTAQASLSELRSRRNWLVEDEHGTRRPMDDGMRRAETARLRQIMRDNCTYAR